MPDLDELARLILRQTFMRLHTLEALHREEPPIKGEVRRWRPLLEPMETLAKHRRIERSGIGALRSFADIWDQRLQQLVSGVANSAPSSVQIRAMTESLVEYEQWLRTHFPNAFTPRDPSTN